MLHHRDWARAMPHKLQLGKHRATQQKPLTLSSPQEVAQQPEASKQDLAKEQAAKKLREQQLQQWYAKQLRAQQQKHDKKLEEQVDAATAATPQHVQHLQMENRKLQQEHKSAVGTVRKMQKDWNNMATVQQRANSLRSQQVDAGQAALDSVWQDPCWDWAAEVR